MNKARYIKEIPQEKPLDELVEDRKKYYQSIITKKFDEIYATGDIRQIGEFEKVVSGLCSIIYEPDVKPASREAQREEQEKPDKRPRLTAYKYYQARDQGLTNKQIKEKFRIVNPYQLGGFGRQYAKRNKAEVVKAEKKS